MVEEFTFSFVQLKLQQDNRANISETGRDKGCAKSPLIEKIFGG